jgi:cytochrome b6-f complex iron-sulfur subunit
MTDKKPTTAEIMAMLRKKPADAAAPPPAPAPEAAPPAAAEATPPAAPAPVAAPAGEKPKGTADIMAAIRAKAAAGAAPAAPAAAATPAPAAAAGAPAAKPKGTADIMAAIRAKGAAPAGAAPAAAPVAAAEAPKAAAPVAAGKSPADMIKAMREKAATVEAPAGEGAVAPAVAKPKFPAKPAASAPAAGKKKDELPRRSFAGALFEALCTPYYFAWTMLSAIGAIWSLGMARFMMPNTVLELPSKFKIGSPGDFPLGAVSEKYKASRGVWIVHTDGYDGQNVIYALSSVCTHLGCTPSWLDAEQKYKCPCHGSGFYITGINFEGPAPRPQERVGLTLGPDGMLEVDKSLKFQEELGQWTDQKSYVKVG